MINEGAVFIIIVSFVSGIMGVLGGLYNEHRINNLRREIDMLHNANRGLSNDLWEQIRGLNRQLGRIGNIVANNDR